MFETLFLFIIEKMWLIKYTIFRNCRFFYNFSQIFILKHEIEVTFRFKVLKKEKKFVIWYLLKLSFSSLVINEHNK